MDSSNFSKKQCNALDNTLDKTYLKRQLYTAYIFRGTRSEPFYGMEAIVPSL